jgi:protein involved in polysaccharide export with SLBB domain
MSAERILGCAGRGDLRLLGQRQCGDLIQAARGCSRRTARRRELLAIEGGALEQIDELFAVGRVVQRQLLRPLDAFDVRTRN